MQNTSRKWAGNERKHNLFLYVYWTSKTIPLWLTYHWRTSCQNAKQNGVHLEFSPRLCQIQLWKPRIPYFLSNEWLIMAILQKFTQELTNFVEMPQEYVNCKCHLTYNIITANIYLRLYKPIELNFRDKPLIFTP